MGDANSSLMDRVFGKLDDSSDHLLEYGSMTMIAEMVKDGYMSLATTNIISAKYAFMLSGEDLKTAFSDSTEDDLVLRAKLSTLRFWPNAQQLFSRIPAIFNQRMINGEAITDLADMLGKGIDVAKVKATANTILTQKKLAPESMKNLTNDEKTVLVQYLSLYNLMKTNSAQYQQYISSLIQQSVLGNSQLMVFKLN